jgi:hypothetical protein
MQGIAWEAGEGGLKGLWVQLRLKRYHGWRRRGVPGRGRGLFVRCAVPDICLPVRGP